MADDDPLAPFELYVSRRHAGRHCLRLREDAMLDVADVFEDQAQYGNGYAWTAVARQIVRSRLPELALAVQTDGNTWIAHSEDGDGLARLGRELARAYHDRAALTALIAAADPRWFQ